MHNREYHDNVGPGQSSLHIYSSGDSHFQRRSEGYRVREGIGGCMLQDIDVSCQIRTVRKTNTEHDINLWNWLILTILPSDAVDIPPLVLLYLDEGGPTENSSTGFRFW